jgi:hypothetical protein
MPLCDLSFAVFLLLPLTQLQAADDKEPAETKRRLDAIEQQILNRPPEKAAVNQAINGATALWTVRNRDGH